MEAKTICGMPCWYAVLKNSNDLEPLPTKHQIVESCCNFNPRTWQGIGVRREAIKIQTGPSRLTIIWTSGGTKTWTRPKPALRQYWKHAKTWKTGSPSWSSSSSLPTFCASFCHVHLHALGNMLPRSPILPPTRMGKFQRGKCNCASFRFWYWVPGYP